MYSLQLLQNLTYAYDTDQINRTEDNLGIKRAADFALG